MAETSWVRGYNKSESMGGEDKMPTNRVLSPRAEAFESGRNRVTEEGLAELRGKTIAFIDDGRPNADAVLGKLQSLMESKYKTSSVVLAKKSLGLRSNSPMPKAVFDDLVTRVAGALVGIGS